MKYLQEDVKQALLFDVTFLKAILKQYIATKQQQKVLNLDPCIIFEAKNLIFRHFFENEGIY